MLLLAATSFASTISEAEFWGSLLFVRIANLQPAKSSNPAKRKRTFLILNRLLGSHLILESGVCWVFANFQHRLLQWMQKALILQLFHQKGIFYFSVFLIKLEGFGSIAEVVSCTLVRILN